MSNSYSSHLESGSGTRIDASNSGKSASAYRTISEVATGLNVPQHVLRFWESKFPQISPLKRGGGRRYYRPEDVQLIGNIKELLYTQGMTIKGVQKLLREHRRASHARPPSTISAPGLMPASPFSAAVRMTTAVNSAVAAEPVGAAKGLAVQSVAEAGCPEAAVVHAMADSLVHAASAGHVAGARGAFEQVGVAEGGGGNAAPEETGGQGRLGFSAATQGGRAVFSVQKVEALAAILSELKQMRDILRNDD